MVTFAQGIVKALNDVRSNVWSIALIGSGVALVLLGHENIGSSLITGAFAVFRSAGDQSRTRETDEHTTITTP